MNQVKSYNKLMLSYKANTFLSSLRRFPFIGRFVPQHFYRYYKGKVFFGLLSLLIRVLRKVLVGGGLVYILCVGLPGDLIGSMDLGKSAFLYLIIFGIASAVFKPDVLTPDNQDQMILNYMGGDPKDYYRYKTLVVAFTKVLYHSFIVSYIFRENPLLIVGLLLFRAFFSLLVTRYTLWSFDHKKKNPRAFSRMAMALAITLLGYLILKFLPVGGITSNLTWPVLVISALGLTLLLGSLWKYPSFKRVARYFANEKAIRISISFNAGATSQTELIRSDSWEVNRSRIKNTTESAATFLEKTFAKRFKSFFTDMIRQRVVILSIVFLVLAEWLSRHGTGSNIRPFSLYLISIATYCSISVHYYKACFSQLDLFLMEQGAFSENWKPLELFKKRYLRILQFDVFLALLLGALISIVKLVSSIDFTWIEILKSMGTFFSLLVIYDNYQSFIYYLIQPYARNFEIRTPYYRYALKIESFAVIAIFFFEADLLGLLPVLFALAILSFIVLYVFIRRKSLQWFRM